MLITRLKKTLLKPARPAKRRIYARTINMQDLEPRLFLSVNSLLSADTTSEQEETSDETTIDENIEAASIDGAQLDASVDTATTDPSSTSGNISGPVASASDPYFTFAYLGNDEFGNFVSGNVAWDSEPTELSGLTIKILDAPTGDEVGWAYADFAGNFYMGNVPADSVVLQLFHPTTGQIVDTYTCTTN
jgi:hypothetical protein